LVNFTRVKNSPTYVDFLLPLSLIVFPDHLLSKQEGATKEDIDHLSKFKFRRICDNEKLGGDVQGLHGGIMTECGTDSPIEHVLSQEDAVCS
jgi:hypothetical protein